MLINNMPFDEYLKLVGVSQSSLKSLLKCPKYYSYLKINHMETAAMEFGEKVHSYLLTPKSFKEDYFVTEKIRKAGKAWNDIIIAANGKKIIFEEELDQLKAIQNEVINHPLAKELFSKEFEPEVSMTWQDKTSNLMCKGRIDALQNKKKTHLLWDLKTTNDATEDGFTKSIFKFGYNIQAAFYREGYKINSGEDARFIFIAVETKPPYLIAVYGLDDYTLDFGKVEYMNAMEKYKECMESERWSEDLNFEEITIVRSPAWYINKFKF